MKFIVDENNRVIRHWIYSDPQEQIDNLLEDLQPEEFELNPFDYFYIDGKFILDELSILNRNNLTQINEIINLNKNNLSATDYKIIKLAEQLFQIKEIREMLNMDDNSINELQEVIDLRKSWRAEINNLEEN